MRSSGLPTTPCAPTSSACDPTGAFISIGLISSGQRRFGQNGAQRAAREGDLEVVASITTGSIQNVGGGSIKGLLARGRPDQPFLRRGDAPRLGSKTAKGETRRTDPSARGVHDCRDR